MRRTILLSYLFQLSLGAFSQGGWEYLPNAPVVEGRFDDIYFINDTTGWAVNGNGEIYKTSNAGESWTMQFDGAEYFRSVEFINDTTGFAGTLQHAVYKTTDSGEHWNRIDQSFPVAVPGICGISHFRNKMIMVGIWNSPAYVLHSLDSGVTWTHYNLSSLASALVDCWYKTIDTVFVSGRKIGTQSGIILRSVDSGVHWEEVSPAGVPDGFVWKLHFVNASTGYASIEESAGNKTHILKTTDGGRSYQLIQALNKNIDAEGIGFINEKVGWMGGWSNGMYRTTNGGLSWTFLNHGMNINRYFILREGLVYAAGASIYRYGDVVTAVDDPVGDVRYVHTMDIFPNPSPFKHIDIKLTLGVSTVAVLEVYDVNGQYVDRILEKSLPRGEFACHFNLENLVPGMYSIVLKTNEHYVRKKVVITKS